MRDWTGTQIRADAETVPCRYCGAKPGNPCWTKDKNPRPLEAFPAHTMRITDAQKAKTQ